MVLTRDIPRLFDDLFFNFPTAPKPPMDVYPIYEDDDSISGWGITMALAGFSDKNIKVEAEGQILHIKGDNSSTNIPRKFLCNFDHKLQVSRELDLSKTKVSLDNGLLQIRIPIAEEKLIKRKLLFGTK